MRRRFAFITILTTLAAASPAAALDRLVDIGNVHWVEVIGEGSVTAPPDFASVALGGPHAQAFGWDGRFQLRHLCLSFSRFRVCAKGLDRIGLPA